MTPTDTQNKITKDFISQLVLRVSIILFFLLFTFTAFNQTYYEVTIDNLNIRAGAGKNFRSVGFLKKGELVTGDSLRNNWLYINSKTGLKGFANIKYLIKKDTTLENSNNSKKDLNSEKTKPILTPIGITILLGILALIILFISLLKNKQKKTHTQDQIPNKNISSFNNKMESDNNLSSNFSNKSQAPSTQSLKLAHEYFGNEWQIWLNSQESTFNLPKQFHETIAFALDNLTFEEKKNILLSFLKVSSNSNTGSIGISISFGLDNYEQLHLATFDLLKTNNFSEISMTNLLKQIGTRKAQQIIESQKQEKDDSIIDVSGESYQIKKEIEIEVPYWEHHYVYSYSEINNATNKQKEFYLLFKENFLNGIYLDLKGNSNYSFILLFDLLQDYEKHRDVLKADQQLADLGKHYPVTKSYTRNFLIRKVREVAGESDINKLQEHGLYISQDFVTDSRLGGIYKQRLNLSNQEVSWLNKFWNPNNVFISIEGCCIQTIKIYLACLKELDSQLKKRGSSLAKEVEFFQNEVFNLYNSKNDSYWGFDNSYLKERAEAEVFSTIFKRVENAVREAFDHKRKISGDFSYSNQGLIQEFESRIGLAVNQLILSLTSSILPPDEKTEEELNAQNVNRWKLQFDKLENSFTEANKVKFIEGIYQMEKVNQKNPSIENIFFEASKFIAKFDKSESLKFYIHYLYYDLKSVKIDNKQLTKTIQKNLFKTNEQLHDFERVVAELVRTKDLKTALIEVVKIYQPKRKKIKLDVSAIKEVQQQDKGTVELLSEYLQDEFEDENTTVKTKEINNEEIKLEIVTKSYEEKSNAYVNEISLNENQINVISLFVEKSFILPFSEIETFCKSKGIFKNQLIDSINESCYEVLDDVLIEEEGETYTLNENYYKKISI